MLETLYIHPQAIPVLEESGTQTDWRYPRNANVQYYPRQYTEEEREKIANSKNLQTYIEDITPRQEFIIYMYMYFILKEIEKLKEN